MATNASSKGKTNEIVSYLVVIVVIGVALAAIIYVYKAQQLSTLPPEESQTVQTAQNNTTPKPTATPMPKAIPHGKIPFSATTTWPGPKFTGGSFDPYDPAKGSTMVITISVNDTQPVQKVWANVTLITKRLQRFPFIG